MGGIQITAICIQTWKMNTDNILIIDNRGERQRENERDRETERERDRERDR